MTGYHHCCRPKPSSQVVKQEWIDGYYIMVRDRKDMWEAMVGHTDLKVTDKSIPFDIETGLWCQTVTGVNDKAMTGYCLYIGKDHITAEELMNKLRNYVRESRN